MVISLFLQTVPCKMFIYVFYYYTFFKNIMLLFSRDALNISKVTVKTFITFLIQINALLNKIKYKKCIMVSTKKIL